jgi:hypothetical protein
MDGFRKAQEFAVCGRPFLWIISFGRAKESISAVGPTNRQDSRFAVTRRAKNTDVFRETDIKISFA